MGTFFDGTCFSIIMPQVPVRSSCALLMSDMLMVRVQCFGRLGKLPHLAIHICAWASRSSLCPLQLALFQLGSFTNPGLPGDFGVVRTTTGACRCRLWFCVCFVLDLCPVSYVSNVYFVIVNWCELAKAEFLLVIIKSMLL